MADVTDYVATALYAGRLSPLRWLAEQRQPIGQSQAITVRRAEHLPVTAGGLVAFSRSGAPMVGEFGDARLLRKLGNVPDDLNGL
jgi:hypothetical protein